MKSFPNAKENPWDQVSLSLHGRLERPLSEAVKVKPGFLWRPQYVRNSRALGYLPGRASNREWSQPKEEKRNLKRWRVFWHQAWRCRVQVSPDGFCLALIHYFFTMFPFSPFGMIMFILCHCMLEVCNLLFDFDFVGVAIKSLPWFSEKTLTLEF